MYYITFSQWTFIWDGFKPPASLAKKFGLSQFAQSFQEVTSRGVPKCGLLRLIPAISTWYPSTPVWCQKRLTSPCKSKDSTTVTIVPHIFTCQPPTAPCQQKNERERYIYIYSVGRSSSVGHHLQIIVIIIVIAIVIIMFIDRCPRFELFCFLVTGVTPDEETLGMFECPKSTG